jgi:hypothetical protein
MADSTTPKLSIVDLIDGQSGAAARVNGNMRILDTLVNCRIIDRDLSVPPGSPSNGDAYIVAAGASGAWASNVGDIAYWNSSVWKFIPPAEGFTIRVLDENVRLEYDGTVWQRIPTGAKVKQILVRIDSPVIDDQIPLMFSTEAITITSVRAVVFGSSSPSILWNLMHNSTRSAAGTQVFSSDQTVTSTTTGTISNSGFNDNTIPASRFVWVEMEGAPSGTVDAVEFYIEYTEDAP